MTDKYLSPEEFDEFGEYEIETCPDCGGPLRTWTEADGPADYISKAECENCGSNFSE